MKYKSQEVPEANKIHKASHQGYRSKQTNNCWVEGDQLGYLEGTLASRAAWRPTREAACRELANQLSHLQVLQRGPGMPNPSGNRAPRHDQGR